MKYLLICLAMITACGAEPATPPDGGRITGKRYAGEEVERVTQALYYNMSNWDVRWCSPSGKDVDQYANPGLESVFFFFEWSPNAQNGYCAKFGRFLFNMGQPWDTPPSPARINLPSSLNNQFSSMSIGSNIRVEIFSNANGLGASAWFECGDFCPGHWNLAAGPLAGWNDIVTSIKYCRLQDKAANGWCPTF